MTLHRLLGLLATQLHVCEAFRPVQSALSSHEVGAGVGTSDGLGVGSSVGAGVGERVTVGLAVGLADGSAVGTGDGCADVGDEVGPAVGANETVGLGVGNEEGTAVGVLDTVGVAVGFSVENTVGLGVGHVSHATGQATSALSLSPVDPRLPQRLVGLDATQSQVRLAYL